MLSLQYGLCLITVQACDDVMARYLEEVAAVFPFRVQARHQTANCTLMVVSPYGDDIVEPKWRAISKAWAQARQGLKGSLKQVYRHSQNLAAWRVLYQLGKPIDQRLFLFQDNDGGQDNFFCLIPADTLRRPWHPAWWIIKAVEALAVHWHTMHGGGGLHACGVARHDHGYLFLGPPGAGKSTVASLSEQAQGTIVHGDQVMLIFHSGHYLLAHSDSPVAPVLRAVFLLRKSDTTRVTALAPRAVCAGLSKSILEYAVGQDHFGAWVRQAFHNAAAIARSVPGYELHFRQSPDFWDMIDAELGN